MSKYNACPHVFENKNLRDEFKKNQYHSLLKELRIITKTFKIRLRSTEKNQNMIPSIYVTITKFHGQMENDIRHLFLNTYKIR